MLTTSLNKKFKPLLCLQCFAWGIKASVAVFALLCMEDKIYWKITFWHLLRMCGKWLAVYGNLRQYMAIHGDFSIVSNWKVIGKELVSDWKAIGRP